MWEKEGGKKNIEERNYERNISDLKNMSLQTEKDPLGIQLCYYWTAQ